MRLMWLSMTLAIVSLVVALLTSVSDPSSSLLILGSQMSLSWLSLIVSAAAFGLSFISSADDIRLRWKRRSSSATANLALSAVSQSVRSRKRMKKSRSAVPVALIMLADREKKMRMSSFILAFAIVLFLFAALLIDRTLWDSAPTMLTVCLSVAALVFVDQKAIEYRVKNHSYGGNSLEAREILEFLIDRSQDDDRDSGTRRKLYPDERGQQVNPVGVLVEV